MEKIEKFLSIRRKYLPSCKILRIMKLVFLFVLLGTLQLSASVYSQTKKVNLNLKNVSLKQVLNELEKQTDMTFLYSDTNLEVNKAVTVVAHDESLEQILDKLFEGKPIHYSMIENHVIITVKETPKTYSVDQQQKYEVTGKVTDDKGEPLAGVNVYTKSQRHGVITKSDGTYSVVVDGTDDVLEFTFIGYANQEVNVAGRHVINITMVEETIGLEEVVTTALGIKRDKKALGYAVSTISADEITATGNPINPLSSLYGKAPGLRISGTSTGPSGGVNIKVRNSVALMSGTNTRPLFVVDGVIIADRNTGINGNAITGMDRGTGINDINGEDIESIEILKGAQAALLYGSEGANGVILITTKSGKKQRGFGVDVSFSQLFHSLNVTPDFQNEYGSGYPQWWTGKQNYANDDGFKLNADGEEMFWGTSLSFGPKMDGRMIKWWDGEMRPYSPQPDNYKQLFEKGHTTNTTVSISNASDIGSYRISYTNQDYKGIYLGFYQKRNSFNFNSNLKISDRIRLTFISSLSRNLNHNSPYRPDNAPTYGLNRDLKIKELWVDNYKDDQGYWKQPTGNHWSNVWTLSKGMIWNQLENENDETRDHLIQTLGLDIELTDWLSIKAKGGVDYTNKLLEYKEHAWRPWEKGRTGTYRRQKSSTVYMNGDAYLSFDKQISNAFRIEGLIGGTYQKRSGDTGYSQTRGFNVENWFSINNSKDKPAWNNASRWEELLYSGLFSVTLSFNDYLFLDVQGRKDWSSILPPDNNSYFYPGVSLSWIASEALSLPAWVTYSKLRMAWADVGRPGPRYFANNTYGWGSYNGVITNNAPSSLPAIDLQPERKREFEIGLETYLFNNNRIGIDFSYYHNNVYDQIMSLPISTSTGANSVKVNAGNIEHNGFELQLMTKPVFTRNFTWDLILNFARDKTKVKELAKGITETSLWGGIGVKVSAEVDKPYGELYYHPYVKNDDGVRIVDDNGFYMIDRDAWEYKGSVIPDVIGGIINTFRYKDFSLTFSIDYQFGATMISTTNMYMIGNGTSKKTLAYRDESHGGLPYYVDGHFNLIPLGDHNATPPSDSRDGKVYHDGMILDGVTEDGAVNNKLISSTDYYTSYWEPWMHMKEDILFKTDYIKLRQLVLSYDIPQRLTLKAGIQALQVSFVADNPWLIYTTLPNVDPEAYDGTNTYSERSQYPSMRSYGFAVKLSF